MSELSLIPLKNNLLSDFKYNEIKTKILNRLTELNLANSKYKLDIEFLTLCCNLIEHLVFKKNKIDKKTLLIDIMQSLFGLTEEEKEVVSNNLNYIHGNNMIKKVSQYKLFKTGIIEFFKKKV